MTVEESLEDECARRIRQNRNICETRVLCPWQPNQSPKKICPLCQLKSHNYQTAVPAQFPSTAEAPYPGFGQQMNVPTPTWSTNQFQGMSSQMYTEFNGVQSPAQMPQFQNGFQPPQQQFQMGIQSPQRMSNGFVRTSISSCSPCFQNRNYPQQGQAPGIPTQRVFQPQFQYSSQPAQQISQIQQFQIGAPSPQGMTNGFANPASSPCIPCFQKISSVQQGQIPNMSVQGDIQQQFQNSSQLAQFQSSAQSPQRISNGYTNLASPLCAPCAQNRNSLQQGQLPGIPVQSEVLNQLLLNQARISKSKSSTSSTTTEGCNCDLNIMDQTQKNEECGCDLNGNSQRPEEQISKETECSSCAEFSGNAQEPGNEGCSCDLNENRNADWHLKETDCPTCAEFNINEEVTKEGSKNGGLTKEAGCPCENVDKTLNTQRIGDTGCECDFKENTQKHGDCSSCNGSNVNDQRRQSETACCNNSSENNQKPTEFDRSIANEENLSQAGDRNNSALNTKNMTYKECGCGLNGETQNNPTDNSRLAGGGGGCCNGSGGGCCGGSSGQTTGHGGNSNNSARNSGGGGCCNGSGRGCCGGSSGQTTGQGGNSNNSARNSGGGGCGCGQPNGNNGNTTNQAAGCGGCGSSNGNSPNQNRNGCRSCDSSGQNDSSLGILDLSQVDTSLLQNTGQGGMNTSPNIADISPPWSPGLSSTQGSPGQNQMFGNYGQMNTTPNIADVTPPWGPNSPGSQGSPMQQGYQDFSQGIRPHMGPNPCNASTCPHQSQFNQTGGSNQNDSSLGIINVGNVNNDLINTSQQERTPSRSPMNACPPSYSPPFDPMNANLINITPPEIPYNANMTNSPEVYHPVNVNRPEPPTGQLISLSPVAGPQAPVNPYHMNCYPERFRNVNQNVNVTPEHGNANAINQDFMTFSPEPLMTFSPEGCSCGLNANNQNHQQINNAMNLNRVSFNQNADPMAVGNISGLSPVAQGNANACQNYAEPMTANLLNLTPPTNAGNEAYAIPLNVTPPGGGILPMDQTPPPPPTSPRSLIRNLGNIIRGQVLAGLRSPPTRNTWIMNDPDAPPSPDPVISPWQSPPPPTPSPNRTWATSSSSPIQPFNITPPDIIEDEDLVRQLQAEHHRLHMCAQNPNGAGTPGYDEAFTTPGFGGSPYLSGPNLPPVQQTFQGGTKSSSMNNQQYNNTAGISNQMSTRSRSTTRSAERKSSRRSQCARSSGPTSPPPRSCRETISDVKNSSPVEVEERPVRRSPCYVPPPPQPPCRSCRYP